MSDTRSYWVVIFTLKTWQETLAAGGNVVGFRSTTRGEFNKITIGDHLLCYIKGISRFIAVQRVESEPFLDDSPVWPDDDFPIRVKVQTIVKLEPEAAVPVVEVKDRLSIFENVTYPGGWGVFFQTSPKRWNEEDGKAVMKALEKAQRAPTWRPVS